MNISTNLAELHHRPVFGLSQGAMLQCRHPSRNENSKAMASTHIRNKAGSCLLVFRLHGDPHAEDTVSFSADSHAMPAIFIRSRTCILYLIRLLPVSLH
jgi:hypothetical protein